MSKDHMTENEMYHWLKDKFPQACWQRIETSAGSGVPDLNYCFPDGREGWIELKGTNSISFKRTKGERLKGQLCRVSLRPAQLAWHLDRLAHQGKVFVLCYLGNKRLGVINRNKLSRITTQDEEPLRLGQDIDVYPMDSNGVHALGHVLRWHIR